MPLVPFDSLPDDARLWVFASDRALLDADADRLLEEADTFLSRWQAHGSPLTCGRDWRDDRFLAIAVDQSAAGASGCSIDGLYRSFSALERELGTRLLAGGRVFHRDPSGEVQVSDRAMFSTLGINAPNSLTSTLRFLWSNLSITVSATTRSNAGTSISRPRSSGCPASVT